jgi:hypothetical protein
MKNSKGRKIMKTNQTTDRKLTYIYIHPEDNGKGIERNLFGCFQEDNEFLPASITHLRIEIAVQKREIELGIAEDYDTVCPWDGVVRVREGCYEWDEVAGDYNRLSNSQMSEFLGS